MPKHTFWTLLTVNLLGQTAIFPINQQTKMTPSCVQYTINLKATDQLMSEVTLSSLGGFSLTETVSKHETEKLPTHINSQIIIAYLVGLK